jgi:hypothetical protein
VSEAQSGQQFSPKSSSSSSGGTAGGAGGGGDPVDPTPRREDTAFGGVAVEVRTLFNIYIIIFYMPYVLLNYIFIIN